ncbi:MAG: 6,7-dimethyl-8-ribityllumazine synthase [Bacteroidetes bacterium]|nr:6,7-dimethyl-8-ribityllumazine synthase [Bacteroidota bacterium]
MSQGKEGYHPHLDLSTPGNSRIALVYTAWNSNFTTQLLDGATSVLKEQGFLDAHIGIFECPGAFELPVTAAWCFQSGFDAVICLGAVIRGDTPHFEYVSGSAAQGILQVGLEFKKPCIFGVLTVNNATQVLERIGGVHGHKGREAAQTALQMLSLKKAILAGQ